MNLSISTLVLLSYLGDTSAKRALEALETFPYHLHTRGGQIVLSVGGLRETEETVDDAAEHERKCRAYVASLSR